MWVGVCTGFEGPGVARVHCGEGSSEQWVGLGLPSECPLSMRGTVRFGSGSSACRQDVWFVCCLALGSTYLLGSLGLFEGQCMLETGHFQVKFGGSILLEQVTFWI